MASAVMFVSDLDRSVAFYQEFLGWNVTIHDESAALLVGPVGYQLYLRSMGEKAQHPLGSIGIQYLIWTARDDADLDRCEQMLRKHSSQVTRRTVEGFSLVEGQGPDSVPVMVAYPGPAQAPRHEILQRIYQW
ncbi:VOC family protein [Pseudarthrobacter sp. alpha12b]